jgi:hypothetical protein
MPDKYKIITDDPERILKVMMDKNNIVLHQQIKSNHRGVKMTIGHMELEAIGYLSKEVLDPSWCHIHTVEAEWHEDPRLPGGGWWSHFYECPITLLQFHCWIDHLRLVKTQSHKENKQFEILQGQKCSFGWLEHKRKEFKSKGKITR